MVERNKANTNSRKTFLKNDHWNILEEFDKRRLEERQESRSKRSEGYRSLKNGGKKREKTINSVKKSFIKNGIWKNKLNLESGV